MKNILIPFLALTLWFSSCKEVGPDINLHGNQNSVSDTSYIESPVAAPELKNVIVEDFSGVQCTNCPQGHVIVDQLLTQYPGRIVAVVYHPAASILLDAPYPFSKQDLENTGSTNLLHYFIDQGFQPEGTVDRKLVPCGAGTLLMDKSCWQASAATELADTPQLNILLSSAYSATNQTAKIIVELHYTHTVTEQNNLTIALTEDSIVTAQLNGAVIDTFYVHNEVFRDFITGTKGDLLTDTLQAGRVIRKIYSYTIAPTDSFWKPANMHVIAMVHEFQNSKMVYQAKGVKLVP